MRRADYAAIAKRSQQWRVRRRRSIEAFDDFCLAQERRIAEALHRWDDNRRVRREEVDQEGASRPTAYRRDLELVEVKR